MECALLLRCGDCLELLPQLAARSVDLVLCDLPYGVTDCAWDRKVDARRLWFRHEWVWDKRGASGWLNARRMPMLAHEWVLVFGLSVNYFPQGLQKCAVKYRDARRVSDVYRGERKPGYTQTQSGWPTSILRVAREKGAKPAQKPVALLEYLIRTYTRPGGVVLDNAMGLGGAGVAAVRTGRRFVGMEIDAERFAVARARIEGACEE